MSMDRSNRYPKKPFTNIKIPDKVKRPFQGSFPSRKENDQTITPEIVQQENFFLQGILNRNQTRDVIWEQTIDMNISRYQVSYALYRSKLQSVYSQFEESHNHFAHFQAQDV